MKLSVNHKLDNSFMKTLFFTMLALIAFAANSVLCRLALGENTIDASSFTILRLLSGALVLFIVLTFSDKKKTSSKGSWLASIMLFLYAMTFSFAYVSLDTGTGALILFGSVQITMILLSIMSGNRLQAMEWVGILIAFVGVTYLVLPSVSTPSFNGLLLMTVAGIAWAMYTRKGQGSKSPLVDTAYNFLRTIPFCLLLLLITTNNAHYSLEGIVLAILSGAIASGAGYTVWYIALRGLLTTQAAVVQLSVPILAALGGVIFVGEEITLRLVISALIILGGIMVVVLGGYFFSTKNKGNE